MYSGYNYIEMKCKRVLYGQLIQLCDMNCSVEFRPLIAVHKFDLGLLSCIKYSAGEQ